jgi:hypothetical protein
MAVKKKNIEKVSERGKASIYDERMRCKTQGYHMQATRLVWYPVPEARESVSCPSSTTTIDQLGLRSEVSLGDVVEVSAGGRPVGEFKLTLKRDVPGEGGRARHSRALVYKGTSTEDEFPESFVCKKVWPGKESVILVNVDGDFRSPSLQCVCRQTESRDSIGKKSRIKTGKGSLSAVMV